MESQTVVVEVDVVTFALPADALQVLLVKRMLPPFPGKWALPGVRLGAGERLDAAARRALRERTGLEPAYLEQLFTFDDPSYDTLRDPRGFTVSVAYIALLPLGAPAPARAGRGVEETAWLSVETLGPLAFDHWAIVDLARARVAAKVEYTDIAFKFLPAEFTMRDLRQVHEALTGRRVTPGDNFWRLMANRWGLEPTGSLDTTGKGRPAAKYHRQDGQCVPRSQVRKAEPLQS